MPTVLIVDDSATDRQLAGGLLTKHGDFQIVHSSDGQEALEKIEQHIPDIIVTDLQMPRLDGLELVGRVKAEFPLIPVVLMTAKGSEEIAVQALQRGAACYVPKRRLAEDLVDTIRRVLSAARLDRNHSRLMHRVTASTTSFVLHNDPELIHALVNHLQQSIRCVKLSDEMERLRVGIALEEALLNAFYHGNLEISSELRELEDSSYEELAQVRCQEDPYRERRIFVDVNLTRNEATYVIRDEGPGFDHAGLDDPRDAANLDRPSGRGVMLMNTFMDEVRYNHIGNEVTLIKRSDVEAAEDDEL